MTHRFEAHKKNLLDLISEETPSCAWGMMQSAAALENGQTIDGIGPFTFMEDEIGTMVFLETTLSELVMKLVVLGAIVVDC